MIAGYVISRSAGATSRTVDNWYCGSLVGNEEVVYRASSYYVYLKDVFQQINMQIIPNKLDIKTDFSKILNLDTWFYYPVSNGFVAVSKWFARSHSGVPHVYILWTVLGAMLTLVILFWIV